MLVEIFQIPQQIIGHAVGTCTDNQPHHSVYRQCLFIFPLQGLQFSVRIGVSLKICQILHFGIFMRKETLSFFQLQGYRLLGTAVVGIESLVIAVGTAAVPLAPVTVGTGKPGIQRNFLYLIRKITFQERRKFIIKRSRTHKPMLFRNKSKTFLRFLLIENGLDMLTTAMEEAHIRQQIHFRVRLHILHANL
jgi:hypothetical protein